MSASKRSRVAPAQYSARQQLQELVKLANDHGLYDAADIVNTLVQNTRGPESEEFELQEDDFEDELFEDELPEREYDCECG